MGLLTPLYALAALAIVGPILFHLIRREPKGTQAFSSLMFLQPSPPTVSKRSRLDNWLLLLLRTLAILLIAVAFARPYLRSESMLATSLSGRNVIVLVDTSASMQREDVWQRTQQEIDKFLDSLSSDDRISLYTVDTELQAQVGLNDNVRSDSRVQLQAVRAAVKNLKPTWRSTALSKGLAELADALSGARVAGSITAETSEIVLFTDLHTDSGVGELQGYAWPQDIRLDVRQILPVEIGNARASLMLADDTDETEINLNRIRIENNSNSEQQTLTLNWANAKAQVGKPTSVQVPAGQVRVVPLSNKPANADRIQLSGDAWSADNEVFVIEAAPERETILYVGNQQDLETEGSLAYFLRKAPLGGRTVMRRVAATDPESLAESLELPDTTCVVLTLHGETLDFAQNVAALKSFAARGGTVLVCLSRPLTAPKPAKDFLDEFLETDIEIREDEVSDYGLIGWVDYQSSVFAPFADPRFNDFSNIRIWSHRVLDIPSGSGIRVVAKIDDDSPFLLQKRVERGNFWVLTAGWQPEASGLALSSKFVPILLGIFDPGRSSQVPQNTFEVGDRIATSLERPSIADETGNEIQETTATFDLGTVRFHAPGLYRIESTDFDGSTRTQRLAIEIPNSESQLVPLDKSVFEQFGIPLNAVASNAERAEAARQMKIQELEQSQRLWQWLLAIGLVVLAMETILAGWLARQAPKPETAT